MVGTIRVVFKKTLTAKWRVAWSRSRDELGALLARQEEEEDRGELGGEWRQKAWEEVGG